ncbi:hypothetical protein LTR62_001068 [Meristemomyces frigidus]|uniref:Ribosomal protein S15 n=1 Tax=Meristemomyces frigidus TaxID=1508187 RepID=A0AAN7YBW4_9PEZI|nr:hypothetical protein LTR62_001068 [Meristemomyces frigidus]
MPPRIPIFQCLRAEAAFHSSITTRSFTSTASSQASDLTKHRRKHDPYAIAQAKARKAANLSRQQVLKQERVASLGDPVLGIETPFLRSFDTAQTLVESEDGHTANGLNQAASSAAVSSRRNFFLRQEEIDSEVVHSEKLSTPLGEGSSYEDYTSDYTMEERKQQRDDDKATAEEALRRISDLSIGSSDDRKRVNIQRCIDTFGRHNTDQRLTSMARPDVPIAKTVEEQADKGWVLPRVGPDTGSSEVQIAILTAKIRTLSEFLQGRGRMDKVNKRNLRLLVHRRQKLLKYLQRSDKGGSRWQHCIETLGLTEGTWKGEISL